MNRRLLLCCCAALSTAACEATFVAPGLPQAQRPSGAGGDGSGGAGGGGPAACTGAVDPGRVTLRRLNRFEYNNTVRDLLADVSRPADDFPADDFGAGFDNLADVLTTPPVLVEKYEAAAQELAQAIIDREATAGQSTRVEAENAAKSTGSAAGNAWNLYSNGTISTQITFTGAGRHTFSVRAWQQAAGPDPAKMTLSLDGLVLRQFDVTALAASPATYTTQADVTAGVHRVEVEFLNDYYQAPDDRNLLVDWLEVSRPGGTLNPAEAKVMLCDPLSGAACTQRIVSAFARKAWRRPPTADELTTLNGLVALAQAQGDDAKVGLGLALQAVLLSPHFLYRVELDPEPTSLEPHPLSDFELAARLSYFLWGSTPDALLSTQADNGTLRANLEAEVTRMLADPKASSLVTQFAGSWLWTRQVEDAAPSASTYGVIDGALKRAMRSQTETLFETYLKGDLDARELLGADFTFVNDALATHYGLPRPGSSALQRVTLTDPTRGSLLGHAGILTVTSFPTRTAPMKRGAWVLGNLLCLEPPPPPAGVEAVPPKVPGTTFRQQLEQHRSNPECGACHNLMDPIGFGLENFDGVGKWRTKDSDGLDIDATGLFPGAPAFDGAAQLSSVLKADARFPSCLGEKLFTYGLGRTELSGDHCAHEAMQRTFQSKGHRLGALILALIESPPFLQRRGEPQ